MNDFRGIGDNRPDFSSDALRELDAALERFKQRRDEFVASAGRVTLRDRHDAGSAADLIGMAGDVAKMVDEQRASIAGPHDAAAKAVNARARNFWAPVEEAMDDVQAKLDAFAAAEKDRIEAQKREQAAEEARIREARAPQAKDIIADTAPSRPRAPERAPRRQAYRGDFGRQAIATDVDVIEIEDVAKLPSWIFEADRVREAIIAVAKPVVKNGVTIPGLKVTKAVKAQVRR